MAPNVTVLMPWRPDGGRRDVLFRFVVERWAALMPDAEVVLGASDAEVFNTSEARNRAWREASAAYDPDVYVIADADHVFEPEWLERSVQAVHDGLGWAVPATHVFLREEASDRFMERGPASSIQTFEWTDADVDWSGSTGNSGLVVVSAEAMAEVRGFDERFNGWGLQDIGFAQAITKLGYDRMKESFCLHLWHPINMAEPTGQGHSHGNWGLYRRYEAAVTPSDIRTLISEEGHG